MYALIYVSHVLADTTHVSTYGGGTSNINLQALKMSYIYRPEARICRPIEKIASMFRPITCMCRQIDCFSHKK